jgi:hypothetical protein
MSLKKYCDDITETRYDPTGRSNVNWPSMMYVEYLSAVICVCGARDLMSLRTALGMSLPVNEIA